jgi:hypothetical protein
VLRVDDAEREGRGEWDEVLRNPRINRAYWVSVLFFAFFFCILDFKRLGLTGVIRSGASIVSVLPDIVHGGEKPRLLRTC